MELRDYLKVLRERMWIVILATVITGAVALGLSLAQKPTYQSEADLLISESNNGSSSMVDAALSGLSAQPERGLQTQVTMLEMRTIYERVIRRLDLRMRPDELEPMVKVAGAPQANVVAIKVTDVNAARAARIANTIADEYSLWVRDLARNRIRSAASTVKVQLEDARQKLADAARVSKQTNQSKITLQIAGQDYAGLSDEMRQLHVQEQMEIGPAQLVSRAAVAVGPSAPKPARNAALGIVLGFVLGVGIAFMADALDTTVKDVDEAADLVGAPVIGVVPLKKGDDAEMALSNDATSPVAEAFRNMRNSLDFINFEQNIKTVLVTSSTPGEGKSTVATNLAVGLARAGRSVVLVSVDFHRPRSAQYLRVSEHLGLSHVLTGQYDLAACLQQTSEPGLLLLASGRVPPNPSELLASPRMCAVVQQLAADTDWVILDGPPVLAVADTTAVTKWVDGVLMVVRAGKTTRDVLHRSVEMLTGVGGRVIGTVLFGVSEHGSASAAYGYSTYSSNHEPRHAKQ